MPRGIFTLKQHLQSVKEKSWVSASTYAGSFNGTNQYLIKTGGTNLAGDFTLEYWMCATAYGNYPTTFSNFNAASGSLTLYAQFGASGSASFSFNCGNGTGDGGIGSTTLLLNTWYHHAVVRSGSTVTAYVNGVSVGTRTSSATLPVDVLGIGAYCGPLAGSYPFSGFITNFRIVNGTAVYTSAFTPPFRELVAITNTQLLTLQGTTIVDTSATANAIANNGTVRTIRSFPFAEFKTPAVDYLVVAGGGGASNAYLPNGGGGAGGLLQGSVSITAGTSYTVTVGGGGSAVSGSNSVFGSIFATGGGQAGGTGGVPLTGGSGGGGTNLYAGAQGVAGQGNAGGKSSGNGEGGGGGAGTVGLDAPTSTGGGNGGAGIASAISGIVTTYAGGGGGSGNGTGAFAGTGGAGGGGNAAVYPTAGANGTVNTGGGGGGGQTSTGGSGIVIISYPDTYAGASATTGSPVVSTSGSGSIAFSGTNQYITTVSASALAFSTNNFTVEGFVYFTAIGTTGSPKGVLQLSAASTGINAATGNSVALGSNATAGKWEIYAGGASTVAATAAPVANTWYHFAIVKNSGTTVLYINGTSVLSVADSTTYTGTYLAVGGYYDANYGIPGYVSNIRVVNGVAVYTGAFTPPAAPLTTTQLAGTNISAITGTSTALLLNTVSGAQFADSSANSYTIKTTNFPTWNQASPFATGLGYKNRVYTYTSSGSITF